MPETGNPGFLVVVAVFIFSFSAALASNAPGGLGVFELVFLKSMPGAPHDGVLAALLLFRLLYLLIPLGIWRFSSFWASSGDSSRRPSNTTTRPGKKARPGRAGS